MILSKMVKIQLVIFTVVAILATWLMLFSYMQVQTQLGVGRITVTLDAPEAGGLYRFGNVTYRGVDVGKVTDVRLTDTGVRATLSIDSDERIPADLTAGIRSMSAVGEQYVDLRPRTDDPPYLRDGSVIDSVDVEVPQPVAPMLEKLNGLVTSIPKEQLFGLVDELNNSLGGRGYDLQTLIDSSSKLAASLNGVGDEAATLMKDAVPLVDSQVQSTDAIRMWTTNLAGFTGQVVTNTPQVRELLASGPGFADEVTKTLDSVELTLPVLLANITSIGQLAVTYNAGLEQILVLLPPAISMIQAVQPNRNGTKWGLGDFRISGISDPPACTVGFLPPSQWRPPEDTSTIDTPDDLYCKLPQNSDIGVRGVRNIPCANKPGKRAPTAAMCNSDERFVPLATRQPVVGPYPKDPGLIRQGVVSPSANGESATPGINPTVTAAQYNPTTGSYVGGDGREYRQADLNRPVGSWRTMLPH
ncbi:MCE family protein [Gordonia sp. HNM0687]|uniref:MCE family protein n=1 Tax=Gordonia mangrovi TaxID=2665643 RepID=A0A6L7GTF3_9ACTN|nr:MlaD family protein [Gordonia mangrovi]MXP23299.1 MCE family protein [Gordonia mangrovi]UVF76785.1 MCE family protein [Gordonia mangrovi]